MFVCVCVCLLACLLVCLFVCLFVCLRVCACVVVFNAFLSFRTAPANWPGALVGGAAAGGAGASDLPVLGYPMTRNTSMYIPGTHYPRLRMQRLAMPCYFALALHLYILVKSESCQHQGCQPHTSAFKLAIGLHGLPARIRLARRSTITTVHMAMSRGLARQEA